MHIVSNPHNGAPIDHAGVVLEPGYEQTMPEREAEALSARFPFLLMRVAPAKAKASKPVKIKGTLKWETAVDADPDVVDGVSHVHDNKAPARKPAAKSSKKKGK